MENTLEDWRKFSYEGECPLFSDAPGLRKHLIENGWYSLLHTEESVFIDGNEIAQLMTVNYREYLRKTKYGDELHAREPVGNQVSCEPGK